VDAKTARALNAINLGFYRGAAAEFAATRRDPWPGWRRLLERVRAEGLARDLSVLDAGCGHGRFAAFLAGELGSGPAAAGPAFRYVGVDASAELLALARARAIPGTHWRAGDLVLADPERALPEGPFSLAVLFGVLHHVPGRERRRRLLEALARRLRPGGLLALTAWRFEAFLRFSSRIVPWRDFAARSGDAIDPAQLEPGDHLLAWGTGGERVRYCHFCDDAELADLTRDLACEAADAYAADGREGELNRYLVLRRGGA
jgi:SAM-dependent methyltransferase